MLEILESLGGNIQCASSRESLMYQSASFNSAVPTTLGLLAETIRDPLITEEEVIQQLATAEYEIGEIWAKPELISAYDCLCRQHPWKSAIVPGRTIGRNQ